MVDRSFCMSSFLALRYIEREDAEFAEGLRHENFRPIPNQERIPVRTHEDMDCEIAKVFEGLVGKRLGILLSGGMDSGSLAAYMPGADAYTFRFLGGDFQGEELARAEAFAKTYGLALHYVDIDWETVEAHVDPVMRAKAAPVHSIEPQLLKAALQAKADGVEHLIVGESADLIFGGMDQLIGQDWTVDTFEKRYTFLDPAVVLREPESMHYLFERYRIGETESIDFMRFMDEVFSIESSGSYWNAFAVAGMPYTDPYAGLIMADPLDLERVRSGEPKYLVRALFHSKYPDMPIPFKNPMPRPVDAYFSEWEGPQRPEFRDDIDMDSLTGNQKWQMWCLERFLNLLDADEAGE